MYCSKYIHNEYVPLQKSIDFGFWFCFEKAILKTCAEILATRRQVINLT